MTGGDLERWVRDYVATYFWPADDVSARGRKKARVLAQRAQALASLRAHAAELDSLRGDFGDETLVVFSTRVGDVELVRALLDAGASPVRMFASPERKDESSDGAAQRPLAHARRRGDGALIALLSSEGALAAEAADQARERMLTMVEPAVFCSGLVLADRWVFTPWSGSGGVYRVAPEAVRVWRTDGPAKARAALDAALDRFSTTMGHGDDKQAGRKSEWRAAGVRGDRELYRGARFVHVWRDAEKYRVEPMRADGRGWVPEGRPTALLRSTDDADLIAALGDAPPT
jgi:hypothetical protein